MATKVRLGGSQFRYLRISADSAPRLVTVLFKPNREPPTGSLYGTLAKIGSLTGEEISLSVVDSTPSGGQVTIETTINPSSFSAFGDVSVWNLEVGVHDGSPGEEGTDYVMVFGTVVYQPFADVLIQSVTVEEVS